MESIVMAPRVRLFVKVERQAVIDLHLRKVALTRFTVSPKISAKNLAEASLSFAGTIV